MAGNHRKLLLACCGLVLAAAGVLAHAQKAERQCLDCHDEDEAIHAIGKTVHGSLAGGGSESCVACHGASTAHKQKATKNPPDVSFGPEWPSDPAVRSASCQTCHNTGEHALWTGSAHQQENLACDSCHDAHQQQDLVMGKQESEKICLDCHTQVRSEMHLPSRHPIAEGKTACTDCHNPHGGLGEAALQQVSVNDNCFSCHADKRGPFLWEHPPAAEDCTLCHKPHGSVNEPLLTARGPALCQQCHAAAFHPSQPYGSEGLPGGRANQNMLGKNCLNCHSQIHGSNHPSGARLTR
jgi:DmsE family decaheme c-type cytochrome